MKIQRKYGTLLVNIILQPQEEKDMKKQRWLSLVLILALVVGLTLLRDDVSAVRIQFTGTPVWTLGYLFVSGAVAITAMVLPGISGSTILLIAGVYLPAIQAIKTFLGLDFSVLPGLCALGLGILAGIAILLGLEALRKWTAQQAAPKTMIKKRPTA